MRCLLENDILKAEVDSFGAELKSVRRKADGQEYLWHGDPKYWGRTSPVLFPFVGSPKNKEYRYGGKTYAMGQHGFARDMEFARETDYSEAGENGGLPVTDQQTGNPAREAGSAAAAGRAGAVAGGAQPAGDTVWFVLASTEETYTKYPFAFRLHIGYELAGNEIKVLWRVENTDTKTMYFSIGAHPAFLCPIHGEADKLGYGLRFGGLRSVLHHHGNTPEGLAVMEDEILPLEDGIVRFTPGFFDKCTYMVEGKQTGEVSLLDQSGRTYVTVIFDTPLFALWSPEGKNAPFVCIEPWYGRCDAVDFDGSLEQREYGNALPAGESFAAEYRIRFS